MKVFDLTCGAGHRFEGWFASAEQFAAQCESHAVRCPSCDSAEVRREPSAPRLNFGSDASANDASRSKGAPDSAIEAEVIAALRRIVAKTEDVGARFAEEARRIHYDEAPTRAIRGTATDRERRDLRDEGIDTLSFALPRAVTETMQ